MIGEFYNKVIAIELLGETVKVCLMLPIYTHCFYAGQMNSQP
uniref:Uncharacterized protein n=1 Tax=Rhizophora mucronata TaxID=61149 RepID=A0A2P2ISK6_RHIMU